MGIGAQLSLAFVALMPLAVYGQGQTSRTLCSAEESVIFSCALLPRKMVSLCSTPDTTTQSGGAIYRFGVPGRTPELTFPSPNVRPATAFKSHFYSWAKGSYSEISFSSGDYAYIIYNRRAAFSEHSRSNGGGIQVQESGKVIRDFWCNDSSIQDNILEALPKLGLPKTEKPIRAP